MSVQDQFSPEQWKVLLNAPGAASMYVSTASGGGLEVFSEAFSASKFSAKLSVQTGGSGYGDLVDGLLNAMTSMSIKEAKENGISYQSKDPEGMRAELKQHVANAVAIAKVEHYDDGFKRWILDMVKAVAETKTGGFMGVGGTSAIDEKEQAAIDELAALFGL